MAERANRNIVSMLRAYIDQNHQSWDKNLEQLAFALRTAQNDTTQFTPAELFLGRKIITPLDKLFFVKNRESEFQVKNMEQILKQANLNIQKGQQSYAKYYNLRRRTHNFQPGQKVLKSTHPLSSASEKFHAKFAPKFEGPYTITEVKDNNLKIKNDTEEITINVDQARPYTEREVPETTAVSESKNDEPQQKSSPEQPQPSTSTHPMNTRTTKAAASKGYETRSRPYNKKPYAHQNYYNKRKQSPKTDSQNENIQHRIEPEIEPVKEQNFQSPANKRPGKYNGNNNKRVRFNLKREASEVPLHNYRRNKLRNWQDRELPPEQNNRPRYHFRPGVRRQQPDYGNSRFKRTLNYNPQQFKRQKKDGKRQQEQMDNPDYNERKRFRARQMNWNRRGPRNNFTRY